MLELFIVRHGESVRNYASLLAHKGDTSLLEQQLRNDSNEVTWPLTALGKEQARAAGGWLRTAAREFDAGFCSPYKRTVETAECLGLNLEFKTDIRLREREWGQYPPESYATTEYLEDLSECGKFEWKSKFPGAESVKDLVPETRTFLVDLENQLTSGRVVIVTHGGRMGAFEYVLHGYIPTRKFANCCILQIRLETLGHHHSEGESRVVYPAQHELAPTDWIPLSLPIPI